MSKDSNIAIWAFVVALIFVAISLLINTAKSCDVSIDYKVTTGSNATQYPNLAEVKLACYKMCIENLRGSNLMQECLDKCEALK